MATSPLTLVCFAVKEEAKPFERAAKANANLRILLTGMGRRNAERAVRAALEQQLPNLVISSGFAGALRADLVSGHVLYAADPETNLATSLNAAGATPGRFICSVRVAATATEKRALWQSTGADAVDMESEVICNLCRERQIPSAIIRIILDAAHQDLPLDFNQLLTNAQQLDWPKLALALIKSPRKVSALVRLRRQSATAARHLSDVLSKVLAPNPIHSVEGGG